MVRKVRTVLLGLGNVNQWLLKLLIEKEKDIVNYGLQFVIVGVADSSGIAVQPKGFDLQHLVDLKSRKGKVSELREHITNTNTLITEHVEAELLIDASPANMQTGSPGLQIAESALAKGWNVVFANKAPLVLNYAGLHNLAKANSAKLKYSATVCGGLPVINVLQRDLKVATLKSLKGIFNATTNFVLNELETGGTMEEAIREAQRIGAAETDPSYDINGNDTANKLFIIMKSFTDFKGTIHDIALTGIQQVSKTDIEKARSGNRKVKLVASAEYINGKWSLSVKPTEVDSHSFLGTCNGWEMGIEVKTDLYETVYMKNYEADPVGTSAAVLRDAIDISL